MGKEPKLVSTDDYEAKEEGGSTKYLKGENIRHHRAMAHTNFKREGHPEVQGC